jgi:coenzyme F420-reducing hydrogenase delta subunit
MRYELPFAVAVAGRIVAIVCEQVPARQVSAIQSRGASTLVVPCVGSVHTSLIEILLREGAAGVMVCGCPPRDCVNREGPKWLHERVFNKREAELQPRVDRRRVCLATFAPGDLAGSLAVFGAFALRIALLDRPGRDAEAMLEAECDPVLIDGSAR